MLLGVYALLFVSLVGIMWCIWCNNVHNGMTLVLTLIYYYTFKFAVTKCVCDCLYCFVVDVGFVCCRRCLPLCSLAHRCGLGFVY